MFVYTNSRDIFPTVEIKGGLCYFLLDAKHSDDCMYTLIHDGKRDVCMRKLDEFDVLIREPQLATIVKKVMDRTAETLDSIVSNDTPFGIPTNPFSSGKKICSHF